MNSVADVSKIWKQNNCFVRSKKLLQPHSKSSRFLDQKEATNCCLRKVLQMFFQTSKELLFCGTIADWWPRKSSHLIETEDSSLLTAVRNHAIKSKNKKKKNNSSFPLIHKNKCWLCPQMVCCFSIRKKHQTSCELFSTGFRQKWTRLCSKQRIITICVSENKTKNQRKKGEKKKKKKIIIRALIPSEQHNLSFVA